jgi:hypothetical protein
MAELASVTSEPTGTLSTHGVHPEPKVLSETGPELDLLGTPLDHNM